MRIVAVVILGAITASIAITFLCCALMVPFVLWGALHVLIGDDGSKWSWTAFFAILFAGLYWALRTLGGGFVEHVGAMKRIWKGEAPPMEVWRSWGSTFSKVSILVGLFGLICSVAIREFQKVDERSRLSGAEGWAAEIRKAQDNYFARHQDYVKTNAELAKLDFPTTGWPPPSVVSYGKQLFTLTVSAADCGRGRPGYRLAFKRSTASSGVARRYGAYTFVYDRCSDSYSFEDCRTCAEEFLKN